MKKKRYKRILIIVLFLFIFYSILCRFRPYTTLTARIEIISHYPQYLLINNYVVKNEASFDIAELASGGADNHVNSVEIPKNIAWSIKWLFFASTVYGVYADQGGENYYYTSATIDEGVSIITYHIYSGYRGIDNETGNKLQFYQRLCYVDGLNYYKFTKLLEKDRLHTYSIEEISANWYLVSYTQW